MKRTASLFTILFSSLVFATVALAAHEHAGNGVATNETTEKEIHMAMVDGHHLTYRLIDMHAKMAGLKSGKYDLSKIKSHHLMLFVHAPDGTLLSSGTVGFLVTGPDGSTQQVMTMAMSGGYGGDVDLKQKGTYAVKAKAIAGAKTLRDQFTFEIQ